MQDHEQETFYLELLRDLLSQPTAPFHEERVAARIGAYLREWGVPFEVDDAGNIIARYQRGAPCRPLVLMAHMDHPAFSITASGGPEGATWTAALEGGVAAACFERPVAVRVYPRDAAHAGGLSARVVGYARGERPRDVTLYLQADDPAAADLVQPGDFGIWDLPHFELRDGVIHARAIDDLAGCAAILLALWRGAQERAETTLYGVFTRAEEVGLVGAQVLMSGETLPRESYIVSLEASPALPGAVQGGGPVIRAGDRAVTFSEEAELALKMAAYRLGSDVWRPVTPVTTKIQRQLMSGGRCEASAAVLLGYQATGLAFPLGNYHNVGEGSVLMTENIHASDFMIGVALLQEAARLMPELDQLRAEHSAAYASTGALADRLTQSAARITAAATNSQAY